MDKLKKIKVTKFYAARIQLQTAIELWFDNTDPIPIHTLAFAAHEIIHATYKKRGYKDLLFDSSLVKDSQRKRFVGSLKVWANFFKHARDDPDKSIDFAPLSNDLLILFSIIGIQHIEDKLTGTEWAFMIYNQIHHPNWFTERVLDNLAPSNTFELVSGLPKKNFLSIFLGLKAGAERGG